MTFLTTLWLPIVLSAVLVFIASSIIWAALQLHKNDYTQTPHDTAIQAILRDHAMGPGLYCIPSRHDGETPAAYQERFTKGPCALLAHPGMAANDTLWRFLGWRHAASSLFDGAVYAALTAGCFAGLWPR